ncbi:MAG TPA: NPCBM/NEW2 domain-containing protein [Tepidisphaeraceae bacterium]|jgi:fibronectin type 3 domain-containing protein
MRRQKTLRGLKSKHTLNESARQKGVESLEGRRMLAAHIVGSSTVYATIQSAVDAAAPGATINVDAGTYNESVNISKTLTLRGAQAGIDARSARGAESIVFATTTAINITANDVTIDGFTVQGNGQNIGAGLGAGIIMGPSIHGTHVVNNIIQNNITGIYLSNDSDTDAGLIQHNLIQNNYEAGQNWTYGWNGSRGIYSDGTVSGGNLTNVLIDANRIYNTVSGADMGEGLIALQAGTAGRQSNITISNNYIGNDSKAILMFNVTNLTFMGNTATATNDQSSGPVRFEGNANTINIQYNTITGNVGPGVAADSAGAPGDSSGFVVNNNNIYGNSSSIGVLTISNVYNGMLYAVGDWWGNASGPSGDGPGTGSAVWANGTSGHGIIPSGAPGGQVTFSPWATALIDITHIPAPAAPTGLALTSVSSTQVNLTWTPQMTTATSQLVQRSTDGVNFTTIATLPPLLNAYTDSTLLATGTYTYRIIASNPTGNSAASNLASRTLLTVPAAPTNVAAGAAGTSQVLVTWTAGGTTQTSFNVLRSTDNVTFSVVATGIAASATSYADSTGLAGGTKYYYQVVALNAAGTSVASNTATVTTISASATFTQLSTLNWTSATAGYGTIQKNLSIKGNPLKLHGVTYASGIGTHAASTITYGLAGQYDAFQTDVGIDDEEIGVGSGSVRFQVIGDGKTLFDTGVITSSTATVHIAVPVTGVQTLQLIAINGVNGSIDYDHADWAGAQFLTNPAAPSAPAAPTGLVATALSTTSVGLSWVAGSANQTSFAIDRSTDNVTFSTVATNLAANATTWTDPAVLTPGTKYYYRVRAVNALGSSPASNTASVTLPTSNLIATPLSNLNWTSATTGYGTIQKNLSIKGNALKLHGTTYATGIGTHAASTITYNLAGQYQAFTSDVGIDDEEIGVGSGSVIFQVIGDGKVLFDSGVLTSSSATVKINVSVAGVQTLQLVATNGIANNIDYDHADWAGAQLLGSPAAPTAPASLIATAVSSNSIKLTWTATSGNQTSYTIDRSTNGTTFTTVATGISASATSWTDPAVLTANTKYYYVIRAVNSVGASPNSNIATTTTLPVSTITYLSDIAWTSATSGWGTVQKDTSIKGNAITLHGTTYAKGLGTHAASTIVYNLAGKYTTFLSDVGIDDEEIGVGSGSVRFQVIGDGKVLFDSGILTSSSPTVSINVSVAGVQTLQLVATNGIVGDIDFDHADWGGARVL